MDDTVVSTDAHAAEEHFKPTGTIFFVALFVAALILLWASVYVILLSRGATA
ncbi:MAG: cytochrome c oxidase subunit 2A [Acidimicrobiales bacterium]